MNTLNQYQQKAHDTKARRQAAGKYPTPYQLAAANKLIRSGVGSLTRTELEALAGHPDFSPVQKATYALRAASM
jgi:hypothetical protein